jgi:hypothetical protein
MANTYVCLSIYTVKSERIGGQNLTSYIQTVDFNEHLMINVLSYILQVRVRFMCKDKIFARGYRQTFQRIRIELAGEGVIYVQRWDFCRGLLLKVLKDKNKACVLWRPKGKHVLSKLWVCSNDISFYIYLSVPHFPWYYIMANKTHFNRFN